MEPLTKSVWGRQSRPSYLPILSICLIWWLSIACSRVNQAADPTPQPIPTTLPATQVNWQAGQNNSLCIDSIVPRPGKPYAFSFTQPVFGRLALAGGVLTYTPPDAGIAWTKDSATYRICQDGSCGTGKLRIFNTSRPTACIQDTERVWLVSALGQKSFTLSLGAQFTAFSAENYTIEAIDANSFRYIAAGNLLNFGYDRITYSYTLNGQCHEGRIEVYVGDSCQPGARPFARANSADTLFITETELEAASEGCRNMIARGTFSTKATGTGRTTTKFGYVQDTVLGGISGIYYKRTQLGTLPDSAGYYFTADDDERITRAVLTLIP